jgi:hypothetical protein
MGGSKRKSGSKKSKSEAKDPSPDMSTQNNPNDSQNHLNERQVGLEAAPGQQVGGSVQFDDSAARLSETGVTYEHGIADEGGIESVSILISLISYIVDAKFVDNESIQTVHINTRGHFRSWPTGLS